MVSKKVKNEDAAKEFLKYPGSAEAQNAYLKLDPSNLATNKAADTSGYSTLQKKAAQYIGNAKQISQFLDRDSNPTFASTVAIPAFQQFINTPNDVDSI